MNYEEKISILLKYRFLTRMRVEPARMLVESLLTRVKSTRRMVPLQCHTLCLINAQAGDSFSNGRRHVPAT
jgi:hypothetical protein